MSQKTAAVFCPVCNLHGSATAILTAMIATRVLVAPMDGREHEKPPYFSYRCPRCGFGEIHREAIGVA